MTTARKPGTRLGINDKERLRLAQKLYRAHQRGESYVQLAKEYGYSHGTIQGFVKYYERHLEERRVHGERLIRSAPKETMPLERAIRVARDSGAEYTIDEDEVIIDTGIWEITIGKKGITFIRLIDSGPGFETAMIALLSWLRMIAWQAYRGRRPPDNDYVFGFPKP